MGIGVFLLIYIFGILFIPYITTNVTSARISLNCSSQTITDGTKLSCLETDIIIPYVILFIFSAAGGYLISSQN